MGNFASSVFMKHLFKLLYLCVFLTASLLAGPPRKGIVYKPTPEGGRACYVDGVFAYEMPVVPRGFWGATYGVYSSLTLSDGPQDKQDWIEYLKSKGITFGKGGSATFHAQFGHLVVVNTREQHAALSQLIGVEPKE